MASRQGFVFSGGIPVVTGFALAGPMSQDPFSHVWLRQDLNLPDNPSPGVFEQHLRFLGRIVFVVEDGLHYTLRTGLTDDHWEPLAAGDSPIISRWAADTDYVEGSTVWHDGNIWRARSTHRSGADFDESDWESASADTFSMTSTLMSFANIPAGTKLENLTFAQMMDMQVNPEIPPNITSFTATPNFGLFERGIAVSNPTFKMTWARTKHPISTTGVRMLINGSQILENGVLEPSRTDIGAWELTNTNVSLEFSGSVLFNGSTNITIEGKVIDTQGLESVLKSGSYTFINPIYLGVVPGHIELADITEAMIKGMTKRIVNRSQQAATFELNNAKAAIWIPDNWGTITRIMDQNNFNNTNAWESREISIVNAANESVSGRFYMMDAPANQPTGFMFTFIF